MSAIILSDEIVHYEVLGRGRPLIFLHGWVGSWRYWIPSMQAASVSYRAYALDLWGFGDTAKEESRYNLQQQLELLEHFIDDMGIGRIAIIGHGLGAIIGMLFADRHPDIVDRFMAIGLPLEASQVNARLLENTPDELASWLLGSTPNAEAAMHEAPKADQNAIRRSLNYLQSMEITEVPQRLKTSCLLVHGASDQAIQAADKTRLNALPENFHYIVFDNAGHFPMLDIPNKFNRLMIDFLSLASGESPRELALKEEWKRRVR